MGYWDMWDKPKCPKCKKEMWITHYEGYYDEFRYWECECEEDDLPETENKWHGQYA